MSDKVCYSNNGLSMRHVPEDYKPEKGEAIFDACATADELKATFSNYASGAENEEIMRQIQALEAQQTPRRMREAAAGTDKGWLVKLNSDIDKLRKTLN